MSQRLSAFVSKKPRVTRRIISFSVACILAISLLVSISSNIFAYTTEGGKWLGNTISIGFYDFSKGYDRQGFVDGYNAWNNAKTHIKFTANGGTLDVHDQDSSDVTWDGLTNYTINAFGYFTGVDAYLNAYYTRNYDTATIQGVAAHELGHAVGLGHSNGCVLMTPNTSTRQSCGVTTPQQDDKNGINSIY